MRAGWVLGFGAVTLFGMPVAAAAVAVAAGHQLAPDHSIAAVMGSATPSSPHATQLAATARTENLGLSIPTVVFGAGSGLPNPLQAGTHYTAQVLVWVSPGVTDASATVSIGGTSCAARALRGGSVAHLECGFVAATGDSAVAVRVTSPSGDADRLATYSVSVAG